MKNFSDRLESLRKGLTQREFALKIGVPLNTYTAWLRNERLPSFEALNKICTACGVSADWLLGLTPTPTPTITATSSAVALNGSTATNHPPPPSTSPSPTPCPHCPAKDREIHRLHLIIDRLLTPP